MLLKQPQRINSPPAYETQNNIDVDLHLEKHHFHWIELYDRSEDLVLRVHGAQTKDNKILPTGTYTLIAKERSLHKEKQSKYTITSDSSIYCGAPDGKIPTCTDHNDTVLISFSTE